MVEDKLGRSNQGVDSLSREEVLAELEDLAELTALSYPC